MKKFRLIIKGRKEDAIKACEIRNVTAFLSVVTNHDKCANSTVIYANASERDVARWFCEPEVFIPKYGYVDGTLLHYYEPKFKQAPQSTSS